MAEIRANMVIEMMGRPPEHLKGVMKEFLKKLDSEKGIKISNKKVHTPKKVEQKDKEGKVIELPEDKQVFSTFAEIEVDANELFDLIRVVFAYMPSHVEILEPGEFKMKNFDLASVLNEVAKKMHQYDAIAKNALLQNQALANRVMQLQQIMQGQGRADEVKDIVLKEDKGKKKKKATKVKNKKTSKKSSKKK